MTIPDLQMLILVPVEILAGGTAQCRGISTYISGGQGRLKVCGGLLKNPLIPNKILYVK